jgi:nicotinate-nucleotide adenylyltransferase
MEVVTDMKTGILGGTFDPVHIGHMAMAEEARQRLKLDEVLFIPAGRPWLKVDKHISPARHRVNMVRLAIKGRPYLRLSQMEIERAGPTYTVDTIAQLKGQIGAAGELYFILGWDNLEDLPRWKEPGRLISLCRLVAVPRAGSPVPDPAALEAAAPGLSKRLIMLDKPEIDISASVIRQRVSRGLSIEHLVPEAVAGYIAEQGLYREKR